MLGVFSEIDHDARNLARRTATPFLPSASYRGTGETRMGSALSAILPPFIRELTQTNKSLLRRPLYIGRCVYLGSLAESRTLVEAIARLLLSVTGDTIREPVALCF